MTAVQRFDGRCGPPDAGPLLRRDPAARRRRPHRSRDRRTPLGRGHLVREPVRGAGRAGVLGRRVRRSARSSSTRAARRTRSCAPAPRPATHQDAAFAAFRAAGFDPDTVDTVVMSHLDGIGMNALVDDDGRWRPAFPNAPIVLSDGRMGQDPSGAPSRPTPRRSWSCTTRARSRRCRSPTASPPTSRWSPSGGHSPGHATVVVRSGDDRALFLGHLAVSPMQAAVDASRRAARRPRARWARAAALARRRRDRRRARDRSALARARRGARAARSRRARPRRLTARVRSRAAPSRAPPPRARPVHALIPPGTFPASFAHLQAVAARCSWRTRCWTRRDHATPCCSKRSAPSRPHAWIPARTAPDHPIERAVLGLPAPVAPAGRSARWRRHRRR